MRLNEPADLLAVTDSKVRRSVFSAVSVDLMRAQLQPFSLAAKERPASSSHGWAIPSFDPSKPQIASRALLDETRDPPRMKSFVFD
ncbi:MULTISPECIES: hypothetical protein [unclassified Bradyrhizobium]|uniref:hypothetical protein n=1 Tax=unclassified Bradyrhizobium TaxID=2631580 RepID=UPI001FF7153B|nr:MULTISPECIES: hypothetical protein [unclassified Bradyrhizobium]MCK1314156.1 hypothetical protein [Bradyrhizobium sp. 23]MCK1569440.1 hypothetical protein [Bradyrhizobium sp. 173]